MLACWVDDPDGDYFKKHLARVSDFIWIGEDGLKIQVRINFLLAGLVMRFIYLLKTTIEKRKMGWLGITFLKNWVVSKPIFGKLNASNSYLPFLKAGPGYLSFSFLKNIYI